ncbi:MAG: type I DNA topoisomerase [Bacteroidales bacterium]|nr:type I DNA topoisomerase [Bacteroidales bacterium]
MIENLVIVESPAKARTIERFLGKDFVVKSSFGHVRDLAKKNLGIDIENNFQPEYIVSADKKKVVKELKDLAKKANTVWIASDEDREGEAIAWHLQEVLDLEKEKTRRIVFHEITKEAIQHAIEHPRSIDVNLVNAQQARRVLDRLVGFELSPLLWKKVKPSLSAGRVQSVAVKLIVEREREVNAFRSNAYYRVTATFTVAAANNDTSAGQEVRAELSKRFDTIEETRAFLEKCAQAKFRVSSVEKKPGKKSPAPPFTTSTLQQEASRKLGYSVSQTMSIAQRLYESGQITYMRTDSVNLSNLAISTASAEIKSSFGEKYLKVRKYATKSKGAQEAHEAIRPTYISNRTINGSSQEQRLYELIWKRTIASQMSDAQLERTTVKIDVSTTDEHFIATGEVLIFDGFLKVYIESTDDENEEETGSLLPPLRENDQLNNKRIEAVQKFTLPPARYTEASLVKKLEELGIGRPSTYAPTISTIQNREYVVKETRPGQKREIITLTLQQGSITEKKKTETTGHEKQKLFPTDIGMVVNDFLEQYFVSIMNYNFTADVEKKFDAIAMGKEDWTAMISEFYDPFHKKVDETMETSEKSKGERLLGEDPESGKPVTVKIGRFGPMVQIGEAEDEEKPRFASLLKGQGMETITLREALDLFKLPRTLGQLEGDDVTVAIGRYGPYVRHQNKFVSLQKEDDPYTVGLDRAIELIMAKREEEKNRIIREFDDKPGLQVLNGKYGPYIAYDKKNYKIPKSKKPEELTLEDCMEIIEKTPDRKPSRRRKS